MQYLKISSILILFILFKSFINAQSFQQISTGAGYTKQSFVNLNKSNEHQINDDAWDLAFTVYNPFNATVFVNESSGLGSGVKPALEVYYAETNNFNDAINPKEITKNRVFNNELDFESGGLNSFTDSSNPYDIGWGLYNPMNHSIIGDKVYVVKLRDNTYKKFIIESLISGNYTIVTANLDGSNLVTTTFSLPEFVDNNFAYFSFSDNKAKTLEPTDGYDFSYQRYISPLDAGNGDTLDYSVTGILLAPGSKGLKVKDQAPSSVQFNDYESQLSEKVDVIGHDWKYFDGSGFSVVQNTTFFIKTKKKEVYKIVFSDFEGSSTGSAVFEKTFVGTIDNNSISKELNTFLVYPNPATSKTQISIISDLKHSQNVELNLININGNSVISKKVTLNKDLNVLDLDLSTITNGTYILKIKAQDGFLSKKIIVN